MNSKERVIATLNHEEPDRVPFYTAAIDSDDVLKGYNEGKTLVGGIRGLMKIGRFFPFSRAIAKFMFTSRGIYRRGVRFAGGLYRKIGIDLLVLPVCLFPIGKSAGYGVKKPGLKVPSWATYVDEYGRIFSNYKADDSDLSLNNYVGGMFDSPTGDLEEVMAKYEKWAPLDPDLKSRYYTYEEGLKIAPDGSPYVIPAMGGYFEVIWESFGFENYSKLLFEHPDFIDQVTNDREEFHRALAETLVEKYNIQTLWIWDDYAYKTGSFISRRHWNKIVKPRMKKIVNYCHKNGVKVLLHSCGNLNKIFDDIVETGIDGLNPIEPSASMDIFQIKRDHGDQLTLIGNVDITDLLTRGTPEEVEAYVKKLIKHCAPGGGLIVASGHSINPAIPFENYDAMRQATFKYGTYPISID